MSKNSVFILGAGCYGEVMCELAQEVGYEIDGFWDDDEGKIGTEVMGFPVINTIKQFMNKALRDINVIVAMGKNRIRRNLLETIRAKGGKTPSLIHPSSIVFKSAKIGYGVYIQPQVFIWTKVVIENDCIISPNVVIAHHSHLGPGCLVSTNAAVGANIHIGKDSFLGMSCNITTGVSSIGENSIVGAGAVVLKDVSNNSVVAGVPAVFLRSND